MIDLRKEDCTKGIFKLDKKSIDIVVTSPPYNIGINYDGYKDKLKHEDYLKWMKKIANGISLCIKPTGHFFLNVSGTPLRPMLAYEILQEYLEYFKLQNTIHWIKNISIKGDSHGHFKPITSNRFLNHTHEFIFHLTKDGNQPIDRLAIGVPFKDKSNIKRFKKNKKDLRCRGNSWFITYDTVKEKKKHPASFPLELPTSCIKLAGYDSDTIVLDPFLGSGTTALAAKNLGINCIGFETSEKYYKEALERLDLTDD